MRFILLGLLLFLPGCGFKTLYHQDSDYLVERLLNQTKIAIIPGLNGQLLYNALADEISFNSHYQNNKYIIECALQLDKIYITFANDSTAQSYEYKAVVNFQLKQIDTNKVIYSDSVISRHSVNIYSKTSNFGQYNAELNAKKKAINCVAEEIYLLLATYYKKWQK